MDWLSVYLLFVEFGITEPLFSLANIRRLPMRLITDLSQQATVGLKQRRNAQSLAVAHLGAVVYSLGMSMMEPTEGQREAVTERDFLPFPELLPKAQPPIKPETREILRWLVQHDSVGAKILPLVSKLL